MNAIFLQGRIAQDPKIGETSAGVKYAKFSVACERPYTDGGQKQVDFIDITAWRNQAELVEKYLTKGRGIIVQGSLRVRNYTDQGGQKRTGYEVFADRLEFPLRDPSSETASPAADHASGASEAPAGSAGADAAPGDNCDPWADVN